MRLGMQEMNHGMQTSLKGPVWAVQSLSLTSLADGEAYSLHLARVWVDLVNSMTVVEREAFTMALGEVIQSRLSVYRYARVLTSTIARTAQVAGLRKAEQGDWLLGEVEDLMERLVESSPQEIDKALQRVQGFSRSSWREIL